jgi:choline dehydrogenase-like flavoprotein
MSRAVDVAIVGSGAAGSVLAYRLACLGLRVVVLERGRRERPETFVHDEFTMLPRLYKRGGLLSTADNDISILQGQTVGGSTVINNAVWLRADVDRLLPAWEQLGAPVDCARLVAAYAELERWLGIAEIPAALMNAGTHVFLRGCAALGLPCIKMQHNRDACVGCGWCNYGCPYNRKNSALITFIPWAEARGAEVQGGCEDVRVVHRGRRARGVTYRRDGETFELAADRVVVAAGAIGSSELLLRSSIPAGGNVGTRFHMLGGVLLTADCPERLDAFDRIGLTAIAGEPGEYLLETFFQPPGALAVNLGGWSSVHAERMQRYAHFAQAGAMIGTGAHGRIRLAANGELRIHHRLADDDLDRLRRGIVALCRVYLAGGATAVYPAVFEDTPVRRPADIEVLAARITTPSDVSFGSAHPQGGNPMSDDPRTGVVDHEFRVHGFDNLYVADASVFPTNIWANCQATVMGLAHLAADHVAT